MNADILNYTDAPTQYIEVDGIRYAYRSLGKQSGIPIVCLQHFTGTLDNWDPVIIHGLAKERPVITIDNTGIGDSGGTTPDNVQDMAQDVVRIITVLGISNCDLLGFSIGGFIAQTLAVIKPGLFRKIILVGTAPQGALAMHSFPQLVEKAFSFDRKEGFLYIFATRSEKSRSKVTAALGRLMERKNDRDKETSMPAIQAQIKALTCWGTDPVTLNLAEVRQPVLIVQGSNDEMMHSRITSQQLFEQIPNAVLIVYPDTGHGMLFEYPEMFANQVNFFLDYFE